MKRINYKIFMMLFGLFVLADGLSQSVAINEDGSLAHASALLDVSSSDKGVLIPSIALTGTNDITTVASPALSLLIYNTASTGDVTPGYYFWTGSTWSRLSTQWRSSSPNVYYEDGFVGIGTSTPLVDLDVTNTTPAGGVAVAVHTEDSGGALAAYSSSFPVPFTHLADRVSLWSNAFTASGLDLRADGIVSDIRMYTGGGFEANERLRITSNGAVGIGTGAPLSKLCIDTENSSGISIIGRRDDNMGTWQQGLYFANNTNNLGPWTHAGIWTDGRNGYNGELVFGVDGDNLNNFGIQEAMRLDMFGNLGIGVDEPLARLHVSPNVIIGNATPAAGYILSVDGRVMAEEMRIEDSVGWPDYVFQDDYELPSLDALKQLIAVNGHLPGIPSADQIETNGIMIGDMQKRQMEKIEELTLYIIELHERIARLEKRLEE